MTLFRMRFVANYSPNTRNGRRQAPNRESAFEDGPIGCIVDRRGAWKDRDGVARKMSGEHCHAVLRKWVIDGTHSSGELMRRRVRGQWQYRRLTAEEKVDYYSARQY